MTNLRIRKLTCPHCSSPIRVFRTESSTYACSACGSVLDVKSEAAQIVASVPMGDYPPYSPITLGARGILDGEEIEVVGRLVYEALIAEWDSEDEVFYDEGKWRFDEWMCVTSRGTIIYLVEDSEGIKLSRSFVPTKPEIPERPARWTHLDGTQRGISEYGRAVLKYFEGEFSWTPSLGDRVHYVETEPYPMFSVVTNFDSKGEVDEVEFFSATPIDKIEVYRGLALTEALHGEETQRSAARSWKTVGVVYALISVYLLVAGIVLGNAAGTTVFDEWRPFSSISPEGTAFGPFHLDAEGSVYEVQLSLDIPTNTSVVGALELTDDTMETVNVAEKEFWSESGYEGGEHWSERDTTEKMVFKLGSPGVYSAMVSLEDAQTTQGATFSRGTARVTVTEGVVLQRYFYIAAFLSLLLGISAFKYQRINLFWGLLGFLILAWILFEMMDDD